MSGVMSSSVTWAGPTGSSHTVCQMPEEAEKKALGAGLRRCLPRGCSPSSIGSKTETTISFSPARRRSVMSKLNES